MQWQMRFFSLISLSYFLLLTYRNATDFSILVLYPVTLLNLVVTSSTFLVMFLGFFCL